MLSHYLVQWQGYQANLQSACERHFLSESFVDVTLAVETGLIKCHRVVLSAASAYFQQLLAQHTMPSCSHPIIFLRDMQYWEIIALVDFMYRGEVSVPAEKLQQLLKAAQMLQIHGLAACLRACLHEGREGENRPNENHEVSKVINKLCELNSELELRPITPTDNSHNNASSSCPLPRVPSPQRNVVKEEIEFIEDHSELSSSELEPIIQIQSVFSSEQSTSEEKNDNSDDCIEFEEEPEPPEPPQESLPEQNFRQLLLVSPFANSRSDEPTQRNTYQETCLYKKYSPRVLEQALRDLNTGRFRSIRACARHHGIPMTTLRYRAKVHTKRSPWHPNSGD